jgi:hypothetical protein
MPGFVMFPQTSTFLSDQNVVIVFVQIMFFQLVPPPFPGTLFVQVAAVTPVIAKLTMLFQFFQLEVLRASFIIVFARVFDQSTYTFQRVVPGVGEGVLADETGVVRVPASIANTVSCSTVAR